MKYTLIDPNGNVLLAVESSPVVTEADIKADLDKAAKACESAFDEVTKYQDAMAVMSSEGFGEQVKAVANKVWEKIKEAIGKIIEYLKRARDWIASKLKFNKPSKEGIELSKEIANAGKNVKPVVEKAVNPNKDEQLESKVDDSTDKIDELLERADKCVQIIGTILGTSKTNFDHDVYSHSGFIKNCYAVLTDKCNDAELSRWMNYYKGINSKAVVIKTDYTRNDMNISDFAENSYLKSGAYLSELKQCLHVTEELIFNFNKAVDECKPIEGGESNNASKLLTMQTMLMCLHTVSTSMVDYISAMCAYVRLVDTFVNASASQYEERTGKSYADYATGKVGLNGQPTDPHYFDITGK